MLHSNVNMDVSPKHLEQKYFLNLFFFFGYLNSKTSSVFCKAIVFMQSFVKSLLVLMIMFQILCQIVRTLHLMYLRFMQVMNLWQKKDVNMLCIYLDSCIQLVLFISFLFYKLSFVLFPQFCFYNFCFLMFTLLDSPSKIPLQPLFPIPCCQI